MHLTTTPNRVLATYWSGFHAISIVSCISAGVLCVPRVETSFSYICCCCAQDRFGSRRGCTTGNLAYHAECIFRTRVHFCRRRVGSNCIRVDWRYFETSERLWVPLICAKQLSDPERLYHRSSGIWLSLTVPLRHCSEISEYLRARKYLFAGTSALKTVEKLKQLSQASHLLQWNYLDRVLVLVFSF